VELMARDLNPAARGAQGSTGSPARAATQRTRGVSLPTRRFVKWLRQDALPFWSTKGWDARRGGFQERFFFEGVADDLVLRRCRVQWRQIYVLAHAAELGWHDGLKVAFKGLEFMIEKAWSPDGAPGFAHILAPDGSVAVAKRDTYDHAFALLALAWLGKATGDAQVRALFDLVLGYCESKLTLEDGSLREALPEELPRRQNSHMHMLEAMLTAVETLNHPEALARATRYRRMLEKTFIDKASGLLVEFFDADWRPIVEEEASVVEPGHMAEWVWLIRRYERFFGQKPAPFGTHLLGAALRAAEPKYGFLVDEIDTLQRLRQPTRRLWPQTELIKAWIAQAEIGADRAADSAEQLIENLMATYLSGPFPGGWYDKYDRAGEISVDTVPASTLYHLFLAAAEADRVLDTP
jgi:mannose/cellobiose epimerase-like protein (N-acyl-D-glucosamine 2-epimerase family)